jgi:hypothetical protein
MFNKTLIVLIAAFVFSSVLLLVLAPLNGPAENKAVTENAIDRSSIGNIWNSLTYRYLDLEVFRTYDFSGAFFVLMAGVVTVVGVDFALRRKVADVIKRHFTQTKNRK